MESSFLYEEIYMQLAEEIRSGRRAPGDRVETERELAEKHHVSRITSKRALNMLAEEGLVVRRRGLGTFVADPAEKNVKISAPHTSFSFKEPSTKRMGLIMEDLGETYALSLFYEIDRLATENGFQTCLSVSYADQKKERAALHQLLSLNVQGIIVLPAHGPYYNTDLLRLVLDHFPIVIIDRPLAGIPAPSVYTDNLSAAKELTEMLIGKGHKNIGFFAPPLDGAISLEERHEGYVQALKGHGLAELPPLVLPKISRSMGLFSEQPLEEPKEPAAISQWLGDHRDVTAVMTCEYGIAKWTKIVAAELGLRVPEDLAICCFDEKYGYLGDYEFTHMKQDAITIATKAMELMRAMLEGSNVRRQTHLIPAHLLPGKTT